MGHLRTGFGICERIISAPEVRPQVADDQRVPRIAGNNRGEQRQEAMVGIGRQTCYQRVNHGSYDSAFASRKQIFLNIFQMINFRTKLVATIFIGNLIH